MSDAGKDASDWEEKFQKFSRPARGAIVSLILFFLYFIVFPVTFEVFEDEIGRALPGWAEEILDIAFWPIYLVISIFPGYEEFLLAMVEFVEKP